MRSAPQLRDVLVVTGAAGFIGSVLVGELNARGRDDLILADRRSHLAERRHLRAARYAALVERTGLVDYLERLPRPPELVYHLGAHTDTSEADAGIFREYNLDSSKSIWRYCARYGVPLVYASSAATYGAGDAGYRDDESQLTSLTPLNAYGRSKHAFDLWATAQAEAPPFWAGLKFFNVYGPNEEHKGRMASVALHAFRQIRASGQARLFRSHRAGCRDGEQRRDFVYVADVCDVITWLAGARPTSGLYNVGTGQARSFLDLADAVFAALDRPRRIEWIDTPDELRATYQYFTQADISKLRAAGYDRAFATLDAGVRHYVTHHLGAAVAC